MPVRLWIDDVREPAPGWVWVKTSADALEFLRAFDGTLDVISFDDDLGNGDTTRPVMRWLVESGHWPWAVLVHAAGSDNATWLVETAESYGPLGMLVD